ncbi:hypothetical protein HK097_011394 [Rhizophlyctis rosea]|uniref:Expansin-like EG45 domain-containing protein n=1 Tax=Rhizophlyctis rosea TaxID=64517 RepID=A0AAD5WZY4_9FUNG|nr:hypothetical protein HK097_011394 [Rhizophlyctis rosea]
MFRNIELFAALFSILFHIANAQTFSFDPSIGGTGDITYYGDDSSGNACLLPTVSDKLFAAYSGSSWSNGLQCGACATVTTSKGSVTVRLINKCPECKPGSLDLSTTAFNKVAALSAGTVSNVSWKFVQCPVSGGLTVVWKEGSTQWWFGIQIRNSPWAIKNVEILKSGNYVSLIRQDYNFFTGEGAGSSVTVRVTDVKGKQTVLSGLTPGKNT